MLIDSGIWRYQWTWFEGNWMVWMTVIQPETVMWQWTSVKTCTLLMKRKQNKRRRSYSVGRSNLRCISSERSKVIWADISETYRTGKATTTWAHHLKLSFVFALIRNCLLVDSCPVEMTPVCPDAFTKWPTSAYIAHWQANKISKHTAALHDTSPL